VGFGRLELAVSGSRLSGLKMLEERGKFLSSITTDMAALATNHRLDLQPWLWIYWKLRLKKDKCFCEGEKYIISGIICIGNSVPMYRFIIGNGQLRRS
jgi:hypothetical protein